MATTSVESTPTLEWIHASAEALLADTRSVSEVPQGFQTALRALIAGDQIADAAELWHAVETLAGQPLADYYGSVPEPLQWIRAAALTALAECDHAVAEAVDGFGEEEVVTQFPILFRRVDRLERAHAALGEAIEQLRAHAAGTARS